MLKKTFRFSLTRKSLRLFGFCLILWLGLSVSISAQISAFTYQGKLTDNSAAANGQYDFRFRLFDALEGGTQIGTEIFSDNVPVSGGIFTVNLDFGANAFTNGAARFLEIAVRSGASIGEFTQLTPRQQITSAPFSIKTLRAASADSLSSACVLCVTDAQIQTVDGSKITGTVANATTAANVSGIVPLANGGTGSATKNFVDLSTPQTIFGNKTFGNSVLFNSAVSINNANPVMVSGSLNAGGAITAEQFIGSGEGLENVPGTFKWQSAFGLDQQLAPDNGYMATNDAQITFTLPESIALGRTIRVSGPGTGGWKIQANPGQSIVGSGFTISSGWAVHESNRQWSDVASSADGTKLVATDEGFGDGRIYTSTDSGNTWTPRESQRNWSSVASSADGVNLVAAARFGQLYTSTNSGVTWTPRETDREWQAVASSADGSKLVAIVRDGQIYTSTNFGATWTPRFSPGCWEDVATSSDGAKLVAVADCGFGGIYTSADSGVTWTPRLVVGKLEEGFRSVVMSQDGVKLAATKGYHFNTAKEIYTSTDSGATWTPRGFSGAVLASSADGTKLVAHPDFNRIFTSADSGATWTARGISGDWRAAASAADGAKVVVVMMNGKIYTFDAAITAGTTQLIGTQNSAIELQYIGNGKFLTLSSAGGITGLSF